MTLGSVVSNDQDPMRLGSGVSSDQEPKRLDSAPQEGTRELVESDPGRPGPGTLGGGLAGTLADKSNSGEPLHKCQVEVNPSMSSVESPLMVSLLQIAADSNARKALPQLVGVSTGGRKMPERPRRQKLKHPEVKTTTVDAVLFQELVDSMQL